MKNEKIEGKILTKLKFNGSGVDVERVREPEEFKLKVKQRRRTTRKSVQPHGQVFRR